jgi:hypothetical protein
VMGFVKEGRKGARGQERWSFFLFRHREGVPIPSEKRGQRAGHHLRRRFAINHQRKNKQYGTECTYFLSPNQEGGGYLNNYQL